MTIAPTAPAIDARLFDRLSVYQDVVLAGQTVRRGARDCEARWELMAPHLPTAGCVLDVGSNFGWFGLRICQECSACVVASVEADERSGTVQREVLRSHAHSRVCLLTSRANRRMVAHFARAGQRFDAALCLSVLHWLPDHAEFLAGLGAITARLFVELPHPREHGAGVSRIRREIGEIGPYLRACFPQRRVTCLGETANHRQPELPRELWLVDASAGSAKSIAPGLQVAALAKLSVSWPPRSWWQAQIAGLPDSSAAGAVFTEQGVQLVRGDRPAGLVRSSMSLGHLRRFASRLPEDGLLTRAERLRRGLRRAAAAIIRGLKRWTAGKPTHEH